MRFVLALLACTTVWADSPPTEARLRAIFDRLSETLPTLSVRLRTQGLPPFGAPPTLTITRQTGQSVYFAYTFPTEILITRGVAELHGDDELAFLLGHELGHVYQVIGGLILAPSNHEHDADAWGFLLGTLAGYDPYAAGAFMGKEAFALGTANLKHQQWLEDHSHWAYRSFNTRLAELLLFAYRACRESHSLEYRLLSLDCAARRGRDRPSLGWLPL